MQGERDLENYAVIIRVITIYLAENTIPEFKRQKIQSYHNALKEFSSGEVGNAHATYTAWNEVVQHLQKVFA